MLWYDRGIENKMHLWETSGGRYQITLAGRHRSFVLYGPRGSGRRRKGGSYIGRFPTLNAAKSEAEVVERMRKENPITPKTRALLGVGLLAGAAVATYMLLNAKPAAAATPGPIGIDPTMAGQTIPVSVGQTVTFSLPLAAGQSWQAALTDPSNVLGTGTPTTQTTSSGESDTFLVAAAGTVQIGYQLYNGSGTSATASGSPLNFTLIATPAGLGYLPSVQSTPQRQ